MGINNTIQEGGVTKQITADKLKTNLVEGGAETWVPESKLGTKNITANGTYDASADGLYGFTSVTVNVPSSGGGSGSGSGGSGSGSGSGSGTGTETGGTGTTGTGQDGNEYNYNTDEYGNIVQTKLPSSIVVTTPPTHSGEYVDGETINKTGMVVKAYYADETEYGIVDNAEITLSPTSAEYNEQNGITINLSDTSILQYPDNNPLKVCVVSGTYEMPGSSEIRGYTFIISGSDTIYVVHRYVGTDSGHDLYFYSKAPFVVSRTWGEFGNVTPSPAESASLMSDEYAGAYYYYKSGTAYERPPFPENTFERNACSSTDFARQIWPDGNPRQDQGGSSQTITVSWPRPADLEVLTTTFDILVTQGSHGGGGGSF